MSRLLEELYFGNINPNEKPFVRNSHYDRLIQTVSTNEDQLTQLLTGRGKSLFLEYANAQSEMNGIHTTESFCDGFRLGAKMMLEVLADLQNFSASTAN